MNDIFTSIKFGTTYEFNTQNKHFSNDEITIGFSGTIYNKDDLVDDCEYIYNAYIKDGLDLFSKLDGIFALYIHDKVNNKLYIARDRVGVHSLYLYENGDSLIFGSKLKEFYKEPSFKKKIDFDALASYLGSGYIIQPYSIFKNTKKIKPGSYLIYDLNTREQEEVLFWSYEEELSSRKINDSETKIITNAHDLLIKSIEKRTKADQNYATTLSGGYDSSLIAALLCENSDKKIDTFTIGFNEQSINEAVEAKKIAESLNTNHHEHYFSSKDAGKVVPKLCEVFDEPFADYGATPTVLMTGLIQRSGFSSMFVGDGGDEVFATADDLINFQKFQKVPQLVRSSIYHVLNSLNNNKFPAKYQKLLQVIKAKNIPLLIQAKTTLFNKHEIDQLLQKDLNPITTFDELNFCENVQLVDQITGTYFKTSMADTELIKSFQSTRVCNLKVKEPFLDMNLISYMSTVPQSVKVKGGEKKHILKTIAYKYIDKNLLDRPKSGFDIPFSSWMKGELKELVYENINEKRLDDDEIFDINSVIKLRDQFYQGNDSKKYKLWTIFIFQMWYKNIKV